MPAISQQDWERMVAAMGLPAARRWMQAHGGQFYTPNAQDLQKATELQPLDQAQPPVYQSTNAAPQGQNAMEDDENPGALSTASAQDDEAMLMGMTPTLGDFMKQYNAMVQAQRKAEQQDTLDRQQLYAAAERNLKDRRYGPSLSEQLFRLSRAIGKPMIRPSFGGVLSNVTGELADMAEAQRKAQEARADAEIALRQQMFTGQSAARNAAIEAQRKGLSAIAPIVAAQAKGNPAKYVPNPKGGFMQQPGSGDLPGMPEMDQYGNYVITDIRQIGFLPPNTPIVRPGDNPMKPKYVPAR